MKDRLTLFLQRMSVKMQTTAKVRRREAIKSHRLFAINNIEFYPIFSHQNFLRRSAAAAAPSCSFSSSASYSLAANVRIGIRCQGDLFYLFSNKTKPAP
jgi:hypothetical protein